MHGNRLGERLESTRSKKRESLKNGGNRQSSGLSENRQHAQRRELRMRHP